MFKADDREKFIASQLPEIQGLVNANVFEFRSMSDLPPRAQLLNAIWSYHHKQCPDGLLLKHKSRICADGSQQQYRIDYWETYALLGLGLDQSRGAEGNCPHYLLKSALPTVLTLVHLTGTACTYALLGLRYTYWCCSVVFNACPSRSSTSQPWQSLF